MRHRRPSRAAVRLSHFRDDTGLIALRYEETKAAEPPIFLPPPRNPRRLDRAPSPAFASSTTASATPITVNPPVAPPPLEEHPLFRARRQSSRAPQEHAVEKRKRDSGAPTSSTVTLWDEQTEDPVYPKIIHDAVDTPTVCPYDDEDPAIAHQQEQQRHQYSPLPPLTARIPLRPRHPESSGGPPPPSSVTPPKPPSSPLLPSSSSSSSSKSPSPRRTSVGERFGKGIGIGPDGSRRIRKRQLGANVNRAAAQTTPPGMEPERGSARSPSMAKSHPSVKLPPQRPGPGPASAEGAHAAAPLTSAATPSANAKSFAPIINTPIPDDSLWEDLPTVSFSKRGSIMFGAKHKHNRFKSIMTMSAPDATAPAPAPAPAAPSTERQQPPPTDDHEAAARQPETPPTAKAEETASKHVSVDAPSVPSIRVSSMDVERESQKVRSLYESGDDLNWEDGGRVSYPERLGLEPTTELPSEEEENAVSRRSSDPLSASASHLQSAPLNHHPPSATTTPAPADSLSPQRDSHIRREYERAGGIEDWADLDGVEVDRYGFITPKRPMSSAGTAVPRLTPFSTRRRAILAMRPSTSHAASLPGGFVRPPSRKVSARSLNTYTSELSAASRRSTRSSIRSATSRIPHKRERRWMDEAGDMLSLQATLTSISDDEKMGKTVEAQKRKEAERSEKWRKMATVVRPTATTPAAAPTAAPAGTSTPAAGTSFDQSTQGPLARPSPGYPQGQGLSYTFDTSSPKLIDRVWKGIPDCWRSAAWWAFLASSAASHDHNHSSNTPRETEDYLIAEFRRLQAVSSPDDVQIDMDVPRTVNGHIMFRRRYRGGQRLLFRVLHAISLYFPDTGYVQGMASLAATLLCYFDEERAFIMLVRLWRYRGLERLYRRGFAPLVSALAEFEGKWLAGAGKDVAEKLNELEINATAYGTRWYLTLFNLSIPFPAQLRVWDVFMLLGDCPPEPAAVTAAAAPPDVGPAAVTDDAPPPPGSSREAEETPPKGLDVLHATAAALIHALRDVLLDSDFDDAMKALTAWIPVRDEDLLMKVARAEWRRHQQGRGGSARLWDWDRDSRVKVREGKEGKEKESIKEGKEKTEHARAEKGKDKERKEKGRGLGMGMSMSMGRLWERGSDKDKAKDKQQQQQQQHQHHHQRQQSQKGGKEKEKDGTA
ncbi:hypothetical protein VTH06DRAFT_1677 [Thermothelomyces fergusii]